MTAAQGVLEHLGGGKHVGVLELDVLAARKGFVAAFDELDHPEELDQLRISSALVEQHVQGFKAWQHNSHSGKRGNGRQC